MKIKAILRFYFTADRVEAALNRLICKRAFTPCDGRGAYECAEEVAELVEKKGELCDFVLFLRRALSSFDDRELNILKTYAFAPRGSETRPTGVTGATGATTDVREGRERSEEHRLAVAFARRIRGGAEKYAAGMRVAAEFCFW